MNIKSIAKGEKFAFTSLENIKTTEFGSQNWNMLTTSTMHTTSHLHLIAVLKECLIEVWRDILYIHFLSTCCLCFHTATIVHQESVCATFGSGLSSACVVDVGDQKTSLCCVEDGVSHRNSRWACVSIKYIAVITLVWLVHFPLKCISLIFASVAFNFAECLWRMAAQMWRAPSTGFCRRRVSPTENVNCPTDWTVSCCSIWRKPSATWTKCVFYSSFNWCFKY